jgi:hypothetical protein
LIQIGYSKSFILWLIRGYIISNPILYATIELMLYNMK